MKNKLMLPAIVTILIALAVITCSRQRSPVAPFPVSTAPVTPTILVVKSPVPSPTPLQEIVYAYILDNYGVTDIYTMDGNGSHAVKLTGSTMFQCRNPRWSPDRSRIVFECGNDLYVMNSAGGGLAAISPGAGQKKEARWSPDGRTIVFTYCAYGNCDIYISNADGKDIKALTSQAGQNSDATWSPDGREIAYISSRENYPEVFVMKSDGSSQARLTRDAGIDSSPRWSPDGHRIAYRRYTDICTINTDGSNFQVVAAAVRPDTIPAEGEIFAWSPDSTRIAFSRYVDTVYSDEIYVMYSDGSSQKRLTTSKNFDSMPSWSPDGSRLVFVSMRNGNCDLYRINTDGSGETRLTTTGGCEIYPQWK